MLLDTLRRNLGFDLRALAFFRMAMGFIILIDLFWRSFSLHAHYTDDGVLPISALLELSFPDWRYSLHIANGETWWIALLFFIQALFAIALMAGYRTRIATIVSWFLIVSLHNRNPEILNGGDVMLRLMLFWSMFLPLGKRFSIDRLRFRQSENSEYEFSLPTLAYTIQIALVYFCTSLLKTGHLWKEGNAVYYTLQNELFASPFGHWFGGFYEATTLLTHSAVYLEKFGWILLFIPLFTRYFRLLACALFMGLHLGFMLMMTLGLFPIIAIIAWIPFLPWVMFEKYLSFGWADSFRSRLTSWIPHKKVFYQKQISAAFAILRNLVAGLLILLVTLWNFNHFSWYKMPKKLKYPVWYLRLDQKWDMFAPNPPLNDGWMVVPALIGDGSEIDLLTGLESRPFDKPDQPFDVFPSPKHRWRKYLMNIKKDKKKDHRMYFGKYLCRKWNIIEGHLNTEGEVESFTYDFMQERTKADYEIEEVRKINIWKHWCRPKFKSRFEEKKPVFIDKRNNKKADSNE